MTDEGVYDIDTSVVVTLHQTTPRDVFPSVLEQFEALIASGRAFMSPEAVEELEHTDDDLALSAKRQAGFVVDATNDEVIQVAAITQRHPHWVHERANAADPFIVAQAVVHTRPSSPKNAGRAPM